MPCSLEHCLSSGPSLPVRCTNNLNLHAVPSVIRLGCYLALEHCIDTKEHLGRVSGECGGRKRGQI